MADPYAYNEASSSGDDDVLLDDEDDLEGDNNGQPSVAVAAAAPYYPSKEPRMMDSDDEDGNDEVDVEVTAVVAPPPPPAPTVYQPVPIQPRGKPEILAARFPPKEEPPPPPPPVQQPPVHARMELFQLVQQHPPPPQHPPQQHPQQQPQLILPAPAAVVAEAAPAPTKKASPKRRSPNTTPKRKRSNSPKPSSSKKKRAKSPPPPSPRTPSPELENMLDRPTRPITPDEYHNLDALMEQFCRIPLLAEFSRPVALLHPELNALYTKIVSHPVDLGRVCRGIRKRLYGTHRDLRLDMWRVFANCVKFHSSAQNRDKVPSFVSIALHLRDYFNHLYQEYLLPSELPSDATDEQQTDLHKRTEERAKRLESIGVLQMSRPFSRRVAYILGQFLEQGGRTDVLDTLPLFTQAVEEDEEVQEVKENLIKLKAELEAVEEGSDDLTIDEFNKKLARTYTYQGVLEHNPAMRNRFRNRLDRLLGKLSVPLHEANSRGVTQSSIWGNIATTIWARESGKKPYWPALCLGILPPEDQREGWHAAVTERNEARLPQKLYAQLMGAKKKCEAAQKRVSLSYFLVEFLGTHEFIWVRETDIVEKFDVKDDPNKAAVTKGGSKKRASRSAVSSVVGSKTYACALEECEWATEEFEGVLQEAFDFDPEEYERDRDEGEEADVSNYSYRMLNESDEEAEAEDSYEYEFDESNMSLSDIEEANYLLAHEGQVDPSVDARKQAKKRTAALKKKKAEEKKKADAVLQTQRKDRKKKLEDKKKEQEAVKEQKELERRRKKRSRDRDKQLKLEMRNRKKGRIIPAAFETESEMRGLGFDNKRSRATAIVKAFVHRMAEREEYQNLKLGGSSVIPSATVEQSGLLSMALAFRVAAGELDDSDGTTIRPLKSAWELIDTETPRTHQERTEALEEKRRLLEEEIERLRHNTRRRKGLFHDELAKKAKVQAEIREDDQCARINFFAPVKKKKKTPTKGVGKPFAPPVAVEATSPTTPPREGGDDDPDAADESGSEMASTGRPFNEYEDDGTEADEDDHAEDEASVSFNQDGMDEDVESVPSNEPHQEEIPTMGLTDTTE